VAALVVAVGTILVSRWHAAEPPLSRAGAVAASHPGTHPAGAPTAVPSGSAAAAAGVPTLSAGWSPPATSPRGTAGSEPATVSIQVAVAAPCVQPGGQQTVLVASRPGLQVTVNPRYADGQTGGTYGGLAVAQTVGPDGTFRETWTVSSTSPTGVVTVFAGVATFTIATRC
jgi:hypothetical protein